MKEQENEAKSNKVAGSEKKEQRVSVSATITQFKLASEKLTKLGLLAEGDSDVVLNVLAAVKRRYAESL